MLTKSESRVGQQAPSVACLSALQPVLDRAGFGPSLSGVYMPSGAIAGVRFVITPDLASGNMSLTCWLPSGKQTRTFDLISAESADIIEHAARYLERDSHEQSKALHDLGLTIRALSAPAPVPQIVGYRVINDMGEQWGGRRNWEVLSEKEAIVELMVARLTSKAFWQIVAILDDEIERHTLGEAA